MSKRTSDPGLVSGGNKPELANPQDRLPIDDPAFWQERIYRTLATGGMLHQVIYDNSYDVWQYVQGRTAKALKDHISQGSRVLDAGCGYGALICAFQEAQLPVKYVGVDASPDLLRIAKLRYVDNHEKLGLWTGSFRQGDLRDLKPQLFVDWGMWTTSSVKFDWVVARSIEGPVLRNQGRAAWNQILFNLLEVAQKVLLIDYAVEIGQPLSVEVMEG